MMLLIGESLEFNTCIIYSLQLGCQFVSLTALIQASKGIDLVSILNNALKQHFLV